MAGGWEAGREEGRNGRVGGRRKRVGGAGREGGRRDGEREGGVPKQGEDARGSSWHA